MMSTFNVGEFESLPLTLKQSDYVDFLLFLSGSKPCIRLGHNTDAVYKDMVLWCKEFKYSYVISTEGFMYIARHQFLTIIAQKVDDSMIRHSFVLGLVFGYPLCCSKKISSVGENFIDEYEKELLTNSKFSEPYHITNPDGYINGICLISHVPCCDQCKKTLRIAQKSFAIVSTYKNRPKFSKWKEKWFEEYLIEK